MNERREQKQLRARFCELAAPFLKPGREDALRAYALHKGGRKLADFISHGELGKLFALHERQGSIPADAPCLYGLCTWRQGSYAEACSAAFGLCGDESGIIIALDGSWMAICQENSSPTLYSPSP